MTKYHYGLLLLYSLSEDFQAILPVAPLSVAFKESVLPQTMIKDFLLSVSIALYACVTIGVVVGVAVGVKLVSWHLRQDTKSINRITVLILL